MAKISNAETLEVLTDYSDKIYLQGERYRLSSSVFDGGEGGFQVGTLSELQQDEPDVDAEAGAQSSLTEGEPEDAVGL